MLTRPVIVHDSPAPPEVNRHDLSELLAIVLQRLAVQVKELAHWWGCDAAYASRVLSGEKPLSNERIAQLPAHVQVELARAWCTELGLLVGARAAAIGALTAACSLLAVDERSADLLPVRADRTAKATLDAPSLPARRRA
jgi:hypothetical protein